MKLTLLNGSPRGKRSNSQVMLNWFQSEYENKFPIFNINTEKKFENALNDIETSDIIVLFVPLYVDSMPAQILAFFERLSLMKEKLKGKKIAFFIHSGFSEGFQSYSLRDTLERIAFKLELELIPTVIMGGSEGVRLIPENYQKKKKKYISMLGNDLIHTQTFSAEPIKELIKPIKLSRRRQLILKSLIKTGSMQMYWNKQLKRNNAYDISFQRPYENK